MSNPIYDVSQVRTLVAAMGRPANAHDYAITDTSTGRVKGIYATQELALAAVQRLVGDTGTVRAHGRAPVPLSMSRGGVSVLYPEDSAAWWLGKPTPWTCAEGGEPVSPPCVHWQGVRALLFHAECAAMLGPHLIADSRECDLAADPEPRWRTRAVGAVRHRLNIEERVA